MKTRKQPERQARQSRVKSDGQIKQPKLKQQIQPRSLSTSCSSSRPAQLRKNRESRLANMAGSKHIWSPEEEEFLLKTADELCKIQQYKTNKNHFYRRLAEKMNLHWQPENSQYVPLTPDKVKTKFKQYDKSWKAQGSSATEMGASSGFHLLGSEAKSSLFSSLFGDSEATSSGSVGVLKQKKRKKVKKPRDLKTALQYMKEHGCETVEYFNYTTALRNKNVLVGFCALETYEERKKYLTEILESGLLQTPSCKLANTPPGEQ